MAVNVQSERSARTPLWPLFAIVITATALSLLAFPQGVFLGADDIHYHLLWYQSFREQFLSGDLHPNWLIDMNAGLGSPIFRYYGPLAFYLTSLLSLLLPGVSSITQLGIAAALFVSLSTVTCFWWLRNRFTAGPAAGAAFLYAIAPYHLGIDLYKRFAFGELLTFVWLPLILLAIDRMPRHLRLTPFVLLAASYAALILSHPPTTLTFSAIPVLYAVVIAEPGERLSRAAMTVGAMSVGIGISAFYLLPAMLDEDLIRMDALRTAYFDFHNWFLFPPVWSSKLLLLLTAIAACQLCVLLVLAALNRKLTTVLSSRLTRFWLLIAIGSCFMMSRGSALLWEHIPLLKNIQFSFRFNVLLLVASAPLIAEGLSHLNAVESRGRAFRALAIGALALMSVAMTTFVIHTMRQPLSAFFPNARDYRARIDRRIVGGSEFLPRDAAALDLGRVATIDALFEGEKDSRIKLIDGRGQATLRHWDEREILVDIKAANPAKLLVRQLYFKTHAAEKTGPGARLGIRPVAPFGLIEVLLPAGEYSMRIYHARTTAQQLGIIASFLTALALATAIILRQVRR